MRVIDLLETLTFYSVTNLSLRIIILGIRYVLGLCLGQYPRLSWLHLSFYAYRLEPILIDSDITDILPNDRTLA